MKKIFIVLILLLSFGCEENISTCSERDLNNFNTVIDTCFEQNSNTLELLNDVNSILKNQNYTAEMFTYTIINFQNKVIRLAFVNKTFSEKTCVLNIIELIFITANEHFNADEYYLIDPEYLHFIKTLSSDLIKYIECNK